MTAAGAASPTICFASASGPNGAVHRGPVCTKAQAVVYRASGNDVVVCGPDLAENRKVAREIEEAVSGAGHVREDPPHLATAGPDALPHFQPLKRPPAGHTFFETAARKALP